MGKFQLFPDQASTMAAQVDYLYFYLCGVTVFFTVLIAALVAYFSIKYRRQSEDERPKEIHPSKLLEAAWIIIPFILTMVMFAWGAVIWVNYQRPPKDAMEIHVIGKQWMWKAQHPDGQREINGLHIPIGRPVRLTMTSQDVIHDFGIPAFRVKMDVLPGRYTVEWFQATKVGKYHLFCDQYCGTQHSRMVGTVEVMTPEDYEAWLSGQVRGLTPVEAGQMLYQQYNCQGCHSQYAPTLAGLYKSNVSVWESGQKKDVLADENYLQDSIVNASHQIVDGYGSNGINMPSFKGVLSDEQVMQLVAYIKTLGDHAGRIDSQKMQNKFVPPPAATPEIPGNTK